MGLDYVDIFYSHRPDPDTPLEETMAALDRALKQGKALYVGISSYSADMTRDAVRILREFGDRCLIHQPRYSILDRWVEGGLLDVLEQEGIGCIPFSPLAQGLLTDKYLTEIPPDSRAAKPHGYLKKETITPGLQKKLRALNDLAKQRNQSLAQMALAWVLKDPRITSVLIGASSPQQVIDNVAALKNTTFTKDELAKIDQACQ
jgi:L-glyceraldehyde 3-phosphate reductase